MEGPARTDARAGAGCSVLALIGSGETSPTMVTIHRELVARLGTRRPSAVLLATPYAFQENADGVSAKARAYFARSVGLEITTVADGGETGAPPGIRYADWVFAGPGSPSYALARWRTSPVAGALRDRVRGGPGITVLASAAAATAGAVALPVYEIYKAGMAPHWLDGLDLLGGLGLNVAVIPHYDNAEGGSYDTRYCYLGERRLAALERELPADAAVLGVDEHTAAVIDLREGTMRVAGRGGVTVRRFGASMVLPSGASATLAEMRELLRGGTVRSVTRKAAPEGPETGAPPAPLPDLIAAAERGFGAAAGRRDTRGMVEAVLGLETAISDWGADTDEDQGPERARAVLRGLIARLGEAAHALTPAVEPLLALRGSLRREGRYPAADAIRDALALAGVEIRDTPDGAHWTYRTPSG